MSRNGTQPPECGALIGDSHAISKIRKEVLELARAEIDVLITGETGVGKDLVARLIHSNSSRALREFAPINCGAIPDTLIESELFGHERNAFTGADRARVGVFEHANGGIVFLDEIGDVTEAMQVKLLRVLDHHTVQRLGSHRTVWTDVRVIAATNRDLQQLMETDRFRRDLYYRLKAGRVHIPPLRERREDVLPLARFFLEKFAATANVAAPKFANAVRTGLILHPWPGNVRELQKEMESVIMRRPRRAVELHHLSADIQRIVYSDSRERDLICTTLNETHWNKKLTAKRLGFSRSALYVKLKKHEIE